MSSFFDSIKNNDIITSDVMSSSFYANMGDPTGQSTGEAALWAAASQAWAINPEDELIPDEFGGNEVDEYSSFHWAQKSQEYAESIAGDADRAETARDEAETAAGDARASRDLAALWAHEDEDVEVTPGEYSAFHWAQKAELFPGHATDLNNPHQTSWTNLLGKPADFPPSTHTHVEADITDLDKYTQGEVLSILTGYSQTDHTHLEVDITDLDKYTQAEVDQLIQDASSDPLNAHLADYANPHDTSWDNLLNKPTGFDPNPHTHLETDITNLDKYTQAEVDTKDGLIQSDLDAHKLATNNPHQTDWLGLLNKPTLFPPDAHQHVEADITNLDKYTQAEVDAKDDAVQAIADSHIANLSNPHQTTFAQILSKPLDYPPSAHTHVEADITNLDKYTQQEVDDLIANSASGPLQDHLNDTANPHGTSWANLVGKPSVFPPDSHTHDHNTDITGRDAIDSHPMEAITGLAADQLRQDDYAVQTYETLIDHVTDSLNPHGTTHAGLIGIGPDDHHNRLHNLFSVDHPDINVASAPIQGEGLYWDEGTQKWVVDGRLNFRFDGYVAGSTYYRNDMVYDSGWLMVAKLETLQRPAPQPVGDVEDSMPLEPTFLDSTHTGVVYSGIRTTFSQFGWLEYVDIYVPEVSGTTTYRILLIDYTDPLNPVIDVLDQPTLVEDEWNRVALGSYLVFPGTDLAVVIDAVNTASSTPTIGGWVYDGTDNSVPPAFNDWNTNQANTLLRINKTDLDNNDRGTELMGMTLGTTIRFSDSVSPAANYIVYVTEGQPQDNGAYVTYTVTVQSQVGALTVGQATDMDASTPIPQPTLYSQDDDYYAVNQPDFAQISGYLELDGVEQLVPNDAFGARIGFQEGTIITDWAVASAPGGGAGGGGGSFVPDIFAGAGTQGYVPNPVSESGRFLSDDGSWAVPPTSPTGTVNMPFTWDIDTIPGDPGLGEVRVNNADTTLATAIYFSTETNESVDVTNLLLGFKIGDTLGMWSQGNAGGGGGATAGDTMYYELTGDPIDQVTYIEMPIVALPNQIDAFSANDSIDTFQIQNPAATLPGGGTTGQVLAKFSNDDFDTYWADVEGGGATDHGLLLGLGDDDHPHYFNQTRGDARYSQLGHTHTVLDITDLYDNVYTEAEIDTLLAGKLDVGWQPAWDDILLKPATFPPSAHTHVETDITNLDKYTQLQVDTLIGNLQGELDAHEALTNNPHSVTYAQLPDKPASFPPSAHTHLWADITDKPTEFNPSAHTHVEADITDLDKYTQAEVDAKDGLIQSALDTHEADLNNPHQTSWTNLLSKPADFPPSAHTHVKADITDFAHGLTEHTDVTLTAPVNGEFIAYDNGQWVNVDAPSGDHGNLAGLSDDDHPQYLNNTRGDARYSQIGHQHSEADITDLDKYTQTEVDNLLTGKADTAHTHTQFAGINSTGFVPTPSIGTDTSRYLAADGTWKAVQSAPAGGISLDFKFDTDTSGSPASGQLAINNADPTLATELHINETSNIGGDITVFLDGLRQGDLVGYTSDVGSASVWFEVTAKPVDGGTWRLIPVMYYSGSGLPLDNEDVAFRLINDPDNRMPAGDTAGQTIRYNGAWEATNDLTVLSSGNVGIGDVAPGAPLVVNKDSAAIAAQNGATVASFARGSGGATAHLLTADGEISRFALGTLTEQEKARFQWVDSASELQILNRVDDGPITFITQEGGSGTEKVRIDAAGDVGIGTTTPEAKLNVSSDTYPTARLTNPVGSGGSLDFWNATEARGSIGVGGSSEIYLAATSYLRFNAAGGEAMRINSAGHVGIGTTTPAHNLSVFSTNNQIARFSSDDETRAILGIQSTVDSKAALRFYNAGNVARGRIEYDFTDNYMAFFTSSGNERMRISADGVAGVWKDFNTVNSSSTFQKLTQAQYDGITPDSNTIYFIVG